MSTIDYFFLYCSKSLEYFELIDSLLLSKLTKKFYIRINQYCYRSVTLTKAIYNIVIFTSSLCIFEKYNKQDNFDCLNLIIRKDNNNYCKVKREKLRKIKIKLSKRVLFNTSINAKSKLI